MADAEFEAFEAEDWNTEPSRRGRGQGFVHFAGAVLSLGLIGGAAFWGYQIAVRDVSGVPVVRALETPMRMAPSNPGGTEADHQGLSVNSVVSAGVAAPVAEMVVLAPAPVDLTFEDGPGLAASPPPVAPLVAETAAIEPPAVVPPVSETTDSAVATAPPAVALAAELAIPVVAPPPAQAEPEQLVEAALSEALGVADPAPAVMDAPDPATADTGPVGADPALATLRPQPRPASLQSVASAAILAGSASDVVQAQELDATTLAKGTRMAQLGAFDDAETARAEWIRISGLFGVEFQGKARVLQETQAGGSTFVRLRVHGFTGDDTPRAFCAALRAKQVECIPVAAQ